MPWPANVPLAPWCVPPLASTPPPTDRTVSIESLTPHHLSKQASCADRASLRPAALPMSLSVAVPMSCQCPARVPPLSVLAQRRRGGSVSCRPASSTAAQSCPPNAPATSLPPASAPAKPLLGATALGAVSHSLSLFIDRASYNEEHRTQEKRSVFFRKTVTMATVGGSTLPWRGVK